MTTTRAHRRRASRSPVQTAALVVGVLFLAVGAAGFIPGLTSGYDSMQIIGHESHAMLLNTFQVSVLHNVVHLAFGVLGVLLSRTAAQARLFLLVGGLVYLALWLYGLVVDFESAANFVPLNTADNWLHLGLGLAMVALSFLRRERSPQPNRARPA